MNITIVQGPFQPVPPVTGGSVEKLWFDLGREFARRGLAVHHISRLFPGLPRKEVIEGVGHHRVSTFEPPRSRVLSKLADLAYSLRCLAALPRADIVVTNTFFLPMLMSLVRRRRVVYVSVHRYPQGQMRLYRKVDRLQCVSTAVADAVREQAPSVSSLVKVIPNYVSSWQESADVVRTWPEREKEILFVGRIHREKGVDLLLHAVSRMPLPLRSGWRLVVVGPHEASSGGGGAALLQELKGLAAQLGLEVQWVGPVFDRAALNRIYGRARIFVYPSTAAHGEALPLAPLEAMAQGCPVVTSDLLCFRDYLEPGRNGDSFALAAADRAQSLGETLAGLMQDEPRQRAYSAAGLVTVERFTLGRIADAFIDDFSQLRRRGE